MALTLPLPIQLLQILLNVDLKSAMNIVVCQKLGPQNLIVYSILIYIYVYSNVIFQIFRDQKSGAKFFPPDMGSSLRPRLSDGAMSALPVTVTKM